MQAQVTELIDFVAPAGTVVAGVRFSLFAGEGETGRTEDVPAVDGSIAGASAAFEVSAGTYHVTAVAIGPMGDAIGEPIVSNVVVVEAPTTITVQVPGAVVLTA